MEKRIIPFNFKALDDEQGIFTGDANVFNVVDLAGERVMPGAFKADLQRRGSRRSLQWQHLTDEPIGVVDLMETERSLRVVRGQLALGVQRAREAYELLKVPGALGGMSIGFEVPPGGRRVGKDGVPEIIEATLFEVSIVTHPANQESRVDSVKARDAVIDSVKRLTASMKSFNDAQRRCHLDPFDRISFTLRELSAKLAA